MDMDDQKVGPDDSLAQAEADLAGFSAQLTARAAESKGQPTEPAQTPEDESAGVTEEEAELAAPEVEADGSALEEGEEQPEADAAGEAEWFEPGKYRTAEEALENMKNQERYIAELQQRQADLQEKVGSLTEKKEELTEEQAADKLVDFARDPGGFIERKIDERVKKGQDESYAPALSRAATDYLRDNPDSAPLQDEARKIMSEQGWAFSYIETKNPATGKVEQVRTPPQNVVALSFALAAQSQGDKAVQSALEKGKKAGEAAERKKHQAGLVGGTSTVPPKAQSPIDEINRLPIEESATALEALSLMLPRGD